MPRLLAVLMLLMTTLLWGFAFVAQKTAMDAMGPLTFNAARYWIGGIAILPLVVWEYRRVRKPISREHWLSIAILCLSFLAGVTLQQLGILFTSVTNTGFLTGLYVIFTPLLALALWRQVPHVIVWPCAVAALIGVFFLNGGRLDSFNLGDLLVIGCALCWTIQVLLIGRISNATGRPVTLSILCFLTTAAFSSVGALAFETPTLTGIGTGWIELLYAGVLSTAVAFTFQAIGQQHLPAANAAIILSAEGLFAALGGALILNERLTPIGYAGAALIFLAIVVVELVPALRPPPRTH